MRSLEEIIPSRAPELIHQRFAEEKVVDRVERLKKIQSIVSSRVLYLVQTTNRHFYRTHEKSGMDSADQLLLQALSSPDRINSWLPIAVMQDETAALLLRNLEMHTSGVCVSDPHDTASEREHELRVREGIGVVHADFLREEMQPARMLLEFMSQHFLLREEEARRAHMLAEGMFRNDPHGLGIFATIEETAARVSEEPLHPELRGWMELLKREAKW